MPTRRVRFRLWFIAGLGCGLVCAAVADDSDEPDADNASDRLGFHFDPAAHAAAVATEADTPPASTEPAPTDRHIVRLPRYTIRDRRLPLAEHDVLTASGRIDVAEDRYLSPLYRKTIGPLTALASLLNNPLGGWAPNAPEAMAFYEQDEQIRRDSEMSDLEDLEDLPHADSAAGDDAQ